MRSKLTSALPVVSLALLTLGCGSSDAEPEKSSGPVWHSGMVFSTPEQPNARGLLDRRGLIHAHSVYSHDACDGEPRDANDAINAPCLSDFRHGLCTTRHDFVMLTDHSESFARSEYPDVLLYDAGLGDALVERDGQPVANHLACPEGRPPLVMAGTETATMPVGLEHHVPGDVDARKAVYGDVSAASMQQLKDAGGLVLAQHTEDWTADQLADLPFDGFEMYNLHANLIIGAGGAIGLVAKLKYPEELPQSDLVLLPIISEDGRYVDKWGTVLSRGVHRLTTLGTDCHQNVFQDKLPDGERIDSYRRMMQWFSNHVLVKPEADGTWDDRDLKDALRAGRAYGAFEVLGYPVGFDYVAVSGGEIQEMGAEVPVGSELRVSAPHVQGLDPKADKPEIVVRLLRAVDTGWELVDEGSDQLTFDTVEAGALPRRGTDAPASLARTAFELRRAGREILRMDLLEPDLREVTRHAAVQAGDGVRRERRRR